LAETLLAMNAVRSATEGEFTGEDEAILVQLAQVVSIACENAQLFAAEQQHRQQLQSLSRRLLEVQEAERRYIARELHDDIGQLLTGLKLTLDMSSPAGTDPATGKVCRAQALVQDLVMRVRDLSLTLRPAMLDDLGLLPALLWHVER
jgi:signal transduction histidine kinase